MFMASEISTKQDAELGLDQQLFKLGNSELSNLAYFSSTTTTEENSKTGVTIVQAREVGIFVPKKVVSACLVMESQYNLDLEDSITHSIERLNESSKTRRRLACEAIEQYPAIRELLSFPTTHAGRKYTEALRLYPEMPQNAKKRFSAIPPLSEQWQECRTEHLRCTVASNWPSEGLLRSTGGLLMGTVLWFCSITFSAVHIAAWHGTFATSIEAWIWRACSVYIGFSGVLWSILHIIAHFSGRIWWFWYDILTGNASMLSKIFITMLCSICGAFYIFSRTYLIVDSFVGLRSETAAAFIIPQWVLTVPHA